MDIVKIIVSSTVYMYVFVCAAYLMDNIALEKLKLNQQDQFGNTALHLACIKVHMLYMYCYANITIEDIHNLGSLNSDKFSRNKNLKWLSSSHMKICSYSRNKEKFKIP